MGIETRLTPLSREQTEFAEILDRVQEYCAAAGIVREFDLRLALSKKGAGHRSDIINAIYQARNPQLIAEGSNPIRLISPGQRFTNMLAVNVRKFMHNVCDQAVMAGWVSRDQVPSLGASTDILLDLGREFTKAGINLQINTGLLYGHTHQAGLYRLRVAEVLSRLNQIEIVREMGSSFAAAVSANPDFSSHEHPWEDPLYKDPDLLMARIAGRGGPMYGEKAYSRNNHG